jgi:hypothetical protein
MRQIFIAEEHDQVYQVWQGRGDRNLKVTHIDFHCDMRGLMIDRPRGQAFMISRREARFVDPGNFLGHAIVNGIVSDLTWVHDAHGGRLCDVGAVVKYETDFTAPLHRWKNRRSTAPKRAITFRQQLLSDWTGNLQPGEHLDIDWDALASVEFEPDYSKALIEDFLARDFPVVPETTFVVFSPDYSLPDRALFESFAEDLAAKFEAELVRLPMPELATESGHVGSLVQSLRRHIPPFVKDAKRNLVRGFRHWETQGDLR